MTVTCSITDLKEDGIEVVLDDKNTGFIKKLDLSSDRAEQKIEKFAIGDKIDEKNYCHR